MKASAHHTPPLQNTSSSAWTAFNGANTKSKLANILSLEDFETKARAYLPKALYGYIAGSVETRQSWKDNFNAFEEWGFVPRVLQNVARRSQSTTLFNHEWSCPFGIAPMGIAALSTYDGDQVMARAAAQANIPFILSGSSLTRLESIMEVAPNSWFQAYLPGEQQRINGLIARVKAAGVKTLVITVDIPVAGNRENNIRAGFSTPLRPSNRLIWDGLTHPRWLLGTFLRTLMDGVPHFENSFAERGAPIISRNVERDFSNREHLDWSHIEKIREQWPGHLIIKGILNAQDAALAKAKGADGIIISNHGGRQLDGAVSPLRVLPDIIQAAGNLPVMLDGGIRRGSDVLKALALGAKFVFLGRPFNFAAATASQDGVNHAIALLKAEIDRNMAMLGVNQPEELGEAFLMRLYCECRGRYQRIGYCR
ncbi:alpha-hydroxy-acid oxidizing protein [Advenella sp. WQ 585]|uniref:Alpha-hydroxy-acid oxidizing protein n=1 Tax=Advenella mandrilli TaxID=2800330 RepID=A0ABS1EHH0_9BURK|nr:alpha-hydroxy acid oxidase [Advenella mandrilli]MBK1782480.1 alpha-hydroxy-acid oxidizing protein [Advenella mandrilli]